MWKMLLIAGALPALALAQNAPTAYEMATLREDVRGLSQRVGELSLRLEQLERENADLRQRVASTGQAYATVTQLNNAINDLNRAIQTSQRETLQTVSGQLEKLGQQTNAALETLSRNQAALAARSTGSGASSAPATSAAPVTFSDNFPKEGISYTVQKGDSLGAIARKTGAKAQDIVNANKLAEPDKLAPGQTLFIPGGK